MKDERKIRLAVVLAALLCVLAMAYGAASEYFFPGLESYVKRRIHFERVISKKGLSMHEARYWSNAPSAGSVFRETREEPDASPDEAGTKDVKPAW